MSQSPKNVPHLSRILDFFRQSDFTISPLRYALLITLLNITLYNKPLFSFANQHLSHQTLNGALILFVLFVVIFTITIVAIIFLMIISRRLTRLVCVVLPIANALALYFITHYQVTLDRTMMGNVLNTSPTEAGEFFGASLVVHLVFYGLIPAAILFKLKFRRAGKFGLIGYAFTTAFLSFAIIYSASSSWLWIDKHAKKLGGMILPWSYIINTARHQSSQSKSRQEQTLLPQATHTHDKKTIVVLVIGETARAKNFSLYGYARETNPQLASLDVIPLSNATACTTYTTGSLECMLSHTSNSSFSKHYEPLPSYLQRHNVDVIWRTNNWGEPPLKVQDYHTSKDLKPNCHGEGCDHDEVLLTNLERRINTSNNQKILVVLHQKGSHGPAYHTRYTEEFEIFKPVCKSVDLSQCSDDELINAYDNTILYTDHFLGQVIDTLKRLGNHSSMMMYLSDHGESLGEYGLYLHGTPYSIAPDVQKEIPFIVWMSENFKQSNNVSDKTLKQRNEHSQHQVFHTVLRALGMQSDVYNKHFDIFQ